MFKIFLLPLIVSAIVYHVVMFIHTYVKKKKPVGTLIMQGCFQLVSIVLTYVIGCAAVMFYQSAHAELSLPVIGIFILSGIGISLFLKFLWANMAN